MTIDDGDGRRNTIDRAERESDILAPRNLPHREEDYMASAEPLASRVLIVAES